jgi:hypothetical protein
MTRAAWLEDFEVVDRARQRQPAFVLEIDLIPARAVTVRTPAPCDAEVPDGKTLEHRYRSNIDGAENVAVPFLLSM